ncbi:hypothetical protein Tco_1211310 [Tanacetum coccineum]
MWFGYESLLRPISTPEYPIEISLWSTSLPSDGRKTVYTSLTIIFDTMDCMMVVKEIENRLLEEVEKFGWWFEQDIGGENVDDNDKKLVMVNEGGRMS